MTYLERAASRWNRHREQIQGQDGSDGQQRQPISVSVQTAVQAPATTVWEFVNQPGNEQLVLEDIVARLHIPGTPERAVGEQSVLVQRLVGGKSIGFVSEIVELEAGRRTVTRSLSTAEPYLTSEEVIPAGDQVCVLRLQVETESPDSEQERVRTAITEQLDRYVQRVREVVEASSAQSKVTP